MRLDKAIGLFLGGYFATCQRSPKTIRAYTVDLEQFAAFLGPRARLDGIRPETLEDWAAELKEARYASASIRRKFASLKVFFNFWVRREVLDRSPTWKIRLDLAPERRLPKTIELEEVRRILRRARAELRPIEDDPVDPSHPAFLALRDLAVVELLFATGIRIGELTTLGLNDYRPEESAFLIQGKGARQRLAFLPDPRSKQTLTTYLAHRRTAPTGTPNLFLTAHATPLKTQGAAHLIRRLARLAGIDRHITPHMFRHTVATLLLNNGADLRVVQEFLGHAAITTTQRYLHISRKTLSSAVAQFHPNAARI